MENNPADTRHQAIIEAVKAAQVKTQQALRTLSGYDLIVTKKDKSITSSLSEAAIKLAFLSALDITKIDGLTVVSEKLVPVTNGRIDLFLYDTVTEDAYIFEFKYVPIGFVFSGFGQGFSTLQWWKDPSKLKEGCERIIGKDTKQIKYNIPGAKSNTFQTITELIIQAEKQARNYGSDYKQFSKFTGTLFYSTIVSVGTSVFGTEVLKASSLST